MNISLPLTDAEADVFRQLFMNGPTQDGDISSKSGRDQLFAYGLAVRHDGWSQLTTKGLRIAVEADMGRQKDRRDRERSEESRARRLFSGQQQAMNNPMGAVADWKIAQ